jgi:hypothetical protein
MWIQIYFIICSIETLALFIYTLLEKSLPEESILLNYSGERLALLALILLVGSVFILLAWNSIIPESKLHSHIKKALSQPGFLWTLLAICTVLLIAIYFLFTQPASWFGARLTLFTRMQPLLFWLLLLSWQTIFFIIIWYCVHFMQLPQGDIKPVSIKEMDILLLIFLGVGCPKIDLCNPRHLWAVQGRGGIQVFQYDLLSLRG